MHDYTEFFASIGMLAVYVFGIYFIGFFISSILCLPYYFFKQKPALNAREKESISSPKNTLFFIFTIIGLMILTIIVAYTPSYTGIGNFALIAFAACSMLPYFFRKKNIAKNDAITNENVASEEPLSDEVQEKINRFQQKVWDGVFSLGIIIAYIGTVALILHLLPLPPSDPAAPIAFLFSFIVLLIAILYGVIICTNTVITGIIRIIKSPKDVDTHASHVIQKKPIPIAFWESFIAIFQKLVFLWKYAASILTVYVLLYFVTRHMISPKDSDTDIIKDTLQDLVNIDAVSFFREIQQLQFFIGAGIIFYGCMFVIIYTFRGRDLDYTKIHRNLVAFSLLQIVLIFLHAGYQNYFYPNPRVIDGFILKLAHDTGRIEGPKVIYDAEKFRLEVGKDDFDRLYYWKCDNYVDKPDVDENSKIAEECGYRADVLSVLETGRDYIIPYDTTKFASRIMGWPDMDCGFLCTGKGAKAIEQSAGVFIKAQKFMLFNKTKGRYDAYYAEKWSDNGTHRRTTLEDDVTVEIYPSSQQLGAQIIY